MDEFKFVIKSFLFAGLLLALSQVQADGMTLEARLHRFLVSAPVAQFVNESVHGGVFLIRKGWSEANAFINEKRNHSNRTETNRASLKQAVEPAQSEVVQVSHSEPVTSPTNTATATSSLSESKSSVGNSNASAAVYTSQVSSDVKINTHKVVESQIR